MFGRRSVAERQGRKEGSENENKLVRPRGRRALQKRIFGAHVKMRGTLTGQLCHPRDTHGILQNAYRGEVGGGESHKAGILLPTMHRDARNVTQKCDSCQVHAPILRRPKTLMTSIMAPWPFYQWGMDILGPLPQASRKLKFVIVAIDYFTKWIEAKPLARITGKDVKKFMWDNIVCRFGLPRVIVTDNGTQFVNDPFKGWCESLNIKQMNTAVAHPQANSLVKRANKSLMEGIKARIRRERAGWVDELPNVLWAHRTSLKQSNDEMPFSLTYRSEAVIPAEIGMPTHRTMMIREDENENELRLNMDLLQERREVAAKR
ncbi:reverse transcriptase domain-containing protein [Tanacetum coccineum]